MACDSACFDQRGQNSGPKFSSLGCLNLNLYCVFFKTQVKNILVGVNFEYFPEKYQLNLRIFWWVRACWSGQILIGSSSSWHLHQPDTSLPPIQVKRAQDCFNGTLLELNPNTIFKYQSSFCFKSHSIKFYQELRFGPKTQDAIKMMCCAEANIINLIIF